MIDKEMRTSGLTIELSSFLNAIRGDNRISPVHISLFIAILHQWHKNDCKNPVSTIPGELMFLSKISGRATYYKSIQELHEYGYLRYKPSHKRIPGSLIYLNH